MDPIQQQLLADPLMQRTMTNARKITKGLQPILAADILDFGDRYEIHTGMYT